MGHYLGCLKPKISRHFEIDLHKEPKKKPSDDGTMSIYFRFASNRIKVGEEIPILGLRDFIGSVGGSLGLFIGFSCYSYLVAIIDSMFKRFSSQ